MDTAEASFTHIVVYCSSALGEQTTPAGVFEVSDADGIASSVAFPDEDLDASTNTMTY